jgi:hypothetical protein
MTSPLTTSAWQLNVKTNNRRRELLGSFSNIFERRLMPDTKSETPKSERKKRTAFGFSAFQLFSVSLWL